MTDGVCSFAYSTDGQHYHPGGDSFKMREGKWIGVKFGFTAQSDGTHPNRGWLDIDWIKVTR